MLELKVVSQFKKDFKKYCHNKSVLKEFEAVIQHLLNETKLPESYRDHCLVGNYRGMRECHLRPDTLLIYWIDKEQQLLYLERIGSHSELFS
jgi:mRNA interferase YafQ